VSVRGERGQATIEFALAIPLVLLLVGGVMDLSRAVFEVNTLAYAARDAARYAVVHGHDSDEPTGPPPDSDDAVKQRAASAAIGVQGLLTTVVWPDGSNVRGSRVTVSMTSRFYPMPMLNTALSITLRGTSTQVILQ
jgi:Flp pilus assembly protein TadG